MANYNLVVNSQFRPYSYLEMLAPVLSATLAHEALEDQYTDLGTKAGVWERLANKEIDSDAYNLYKKYSDDLQALALELAQKGLNATSRASLSKMKSRYSSEIVPLENAYTRRETLAKEQRAALNADPTLMYQRNMANTSLNDFLANPQLDYGLRYSGALLAKLVAEATLGIRERLSYAGKGRPLDAYTNTFLKQYGVSPELVLDAINNPQRATSQPILSGIVESVVGASRIKDWKNDELTQQAYNWANQGLWSAVGKSDITPIDNFGSRQGLALANDLAKMKQEHAYRMEEMNAKNKPEPEAPDVPGDTFPLAFTNKDIPSKGMKTNAAVATAQYLNSILGKSTTALNIYNYWKDKGGWEAAIKHWQDNGFNGAWLQKSKGVNDNSYYGLKSYLRQHVSGNEKLINTWVNPYEGVNGKPVGKEQSISKADLIKQINAATPGSDERRELAKKLQAIDYQSSPVQLIGKPAPRATATPPHKDWKDWDTEAKRAYKVNAVALHDNKEQLQEFLQSTLDRNTSNGNVSLYDIKSIAPNGTYTYSKVGTPLKQLPTTSTGKIDADRISRGVLSNGDQVLTWQDGENTIMKVLPKEYISGEAIEEWRQTSAGEKALLNQVTRGDIDYNTYQKKLSKIGSSHLAKVYSLSRPVKVEEVKL